MIRAGDSYLERKCKKQKVRILCNFDRTMYRAKPDPEQIKRIQCNSEKPMEVEIEDLFQLICSGGSFRASAVKGKTDKGFVSQQLFAVDIDNSKGKEPIPKNEYLTPEQAISRAKAAGLTPNFIYPTFSDSSALRKYRILFLMDTPITEHGLRGRIEDYITSIFGNAADSKCKNPARLFFGTNKPSILTDIDHTNHIAEIERLLPEIPKKEPPKSKVKTKKIAKQTSKVGSGRKSNIELIKAHEWEELAKRIGSKGTIVFNNSKDFLNYVYSKLSISDLIEVDNPRSFCCIFHDDRNPSASIFTDKHGNQRYKCNSTCCGVNMNIKQIIEELVGSKSEYRTFEIIKSIYNLSVADTEWSREQRANIDSIINCMTSDTGNGFSDICPTAFKTTRNATFIYLQILNIARNSIFPEPIDANEGNIIFTMSIRQLAKVAGKSSIDKVSKYIKMLIYHDMLEIVPDESVPKHLLDRANTKRTDKKHCHTNFYRIPSWVYRQTRLIDEQGVKWKRKNYRLNGISYEMFLRSEGPEMAKKLYPQTATFTTKTGKIAQRTTTKESDKLTLILSGIILEMIQDVGYATERNAIEKAVNMIFT